MPGKIISKNFVLNNVTLEEVEKFAALRQWNFRSENVGSPNNPYSKVWLLPQGKASVIFTYDQILDVKFLEVRVEEGAIKFDEVITGIPVLGFNEIVQLYNAAGTAEQKIQALNFAIISAYTQKYSGPYFEFFKTALANADSAIRRSAIYSAVYTQWQEFQPLLEIMAKEEGQIGPFAQKALDAIAYGQTIYKQK